jgi:hypothetical protein
MADILSFLTSGLCVLSEFKMAGILEFFTAGVFHQTVSVDENAIR